MQQEGQPSFESPAPAIQSFCFEVPCPMGSNFWKLRLIKQKRDYEKVLVILVFVVINLNVFYRTTY